MVETNEQPELLFFRKTPDRLLSRPPLSSSLQHLESAFLLVAMGRFPHALVTTASSVESAMKAAFGLPPKPSVNAATLYAKAVTHYPALSSFDDQDLRTFRGTRNQITHYGFSPHDDGMAAALLLKIGLPFLSACYKELFDFDLLDGLVVELGEQLRIALNVYQKARAKPDVHFTYCFSAFAHLVRWSMKQSLMADWENEAAVYAEEIGEKFIRCKELKGELELFFGAAWFFNCPICNELDTIVCELDEDRLNEGEVVLQRAVCASCGLVVPKNAPFLADALCREQVASKREEILRDFGLASRIESGRAGRPRSQESHS